jgi:hypothetical protein
MLAVAAAAVAVVPANTTSRLELPQRLLATVELLVLIVALAAVAAAERHS